MTPEGTEQGGRINVNKAFFDIAGLLKITFGC